MTNMVLGGQGDGQGADKPLSMADVVKQAAAGQFQMSNHFLSTPVLMHGGLICIAFCLSVI